MTKPPYLSSDLPGIGGHLKSEPADFFVEELPAYEPQGAGEHLFLWIEKVDLAAEELVKRLARAFEIRRDDIGVAGLKDRRAITRQFVSVPASCAPRVDSFSDESIHILSATPHENKLKTGHLRGNLFKIRLRGPFGPGDTSDLAPEEIQTRALAIAKRLREQGLPNFYGDQRFGHDGGTLNLGLELLRGESTPKRIPLARRKFLLRLALSAVQSHLFNEALIDRLEKNAFAQVFEGDVLRKTDSGGLFVCDDPIVDQQRLDAGEIDITGPVFGPKMKSPTGLPAEWEQALLAKSGLTREHFQAFRKLTPGTRRPFRVPLGDLSVSFDDGVLLEFSLPSGSYATILAREFQKSDGDETPPPPELTD